MIKVIGAVLWNTDFKDFSINHRSDIFSGHFGKVLEETFQNHETLKVTFTLLTYRHLKDRLVICVIVPISAMGRDSISQQQSSVHPASIFSDGFPHSKSMEVALLLSCFYFVYIDIPGLKLSLDN